MFNISNYLLHIYHLLHSIGKDFPDLQNIIRKDFAAIENVLQNNAIDPEEANKELLKIITPTIQDFKNLEENNFPEYRIYKQYLTLLMMIESEIQQSGKDAYFVLKKFHDEVLQHGLEGLSLPEENTPHWHNNETKKIMTDIDPKYNEVVGAETLNDIDFRGDTRHPNEIFNFGFQRRGGSWEHYNVSKKILEPTVRFFQNNPRKREDVDILPASGVCVTQVFDLAAMFPLENPEAKGLPPPEKIWIYVVCVQQGFRTYELQSKLGSKLAFCQEVVSRDIPAGDVICAIGCTRYMNVDHKTGNYSWESGVHYRLTSDIVWNPKLQNEVQTPYKVNRNEAITRLVNKRTGKFIECPIPTNDQELEQVKSGKFSYKMQELTNLQHEEKILINFYHKMEDAIHEIDPEKRAKKINKAIAVLNDSQDINQFIPNTNMTPLIYAYKNGIVPLATYLEKRNADHEIKDIYGQTAVNALLQSPICQSPQLISETLMNAYRSGNHNNKFFNTLLKHKNATGLNDLLYQAVVKKNYSLVNKLLDKNKADVNAQINYETPLVAALKAKDIGMVELLLMFNADITKSNEDTYITPLSLVIKSQLKLDDKLYERFISLLNDVDQLDDAGNAAIHYAATYGKANILQDLLSKEADVNLKNNLDQSVFFLVANSTSCSKQDQIECLQVLFAKKNLNLTEDEDQEALSTLDQEVLSTLLFSQITELVSTTKKSDVPEKYRLIDLLLTHEADPTIPDNHHQSALDLVRLSDDEKLKNIFRDHGYEPSSVQKMGL